MRVKKLKEQEGKLLIFGGVYSNFEALKSLRKKAELLGIPPDQIFCTGDVVAYCAEPAACIDEMLDWGIHCIAGNVELNLLNKADDCGCNFNEGSRCDLFSKNWYPYVKSKLESRHQTFLESLPEFLSFNYHKKQVFMLHGGLENTSAYVFKSSPWELKKDVFEKTESDVIIAGHCGLPFHDQFEGKDWINAGVIGMPANDGKTNTWYALLDIENNELQLEFCQLNYDHVRTAEHMEKAGLPLAYAKTLRDGIWDNCEILPDWETSQQGRNLLLDKKPLDPHLI